MRLTIERPGFEAEVIECTHLVASALDDSLLVISAVNGPAEGRTPVETAYVSVQPGIMITVAP